MKTETITFLTWPSTDSSGWIMVHACSHMTHAGKPSFPEGPTSHGVITGFTELNIPVPKEHLIPYLAHFIHKTLKLTDHVHIFKHEVRDLGHSKDYIVTYFPKEEA